MLSALIDSSGNTILVGCAEPEGRLLSLIEAEHTKQNSTRISSLLAEALRQAGGKFEDIGLICVGCGPGTFIGTRTGVAFANGAASTSGISGIGVGSMEAAAAYHCLNARNVMVVRQARRGAAFAGVYKHFDSGVRTLAERELVYSEFPELIKSSIELSQKGSLFILTDCEEFAAAAGSASGLMAAIDFKRCNLADLNGLALLSEARRSSAGGIIDVRYIRPPV